MATKVLKKAGATVRAQAMMYNTVVCMVLIYRRKSWVVTEMIMKVLEGFHHKLSWRISGMLDCQVG